MKKENNKNILKVLFIIFEIISVLGLAFLTAYRITKVTDSMILTQWKIAIFWDVVAVIVFGIYFVVDKYLFKFDIDGDKFKMEMIAYTVIYMIIIAIFAYIETKSLFTAIFAPIIFTPAAIIAILAACGGGAVADMTPAVNYDIKTNEYYNQFGKYKGKKTTYTGLGGVTHSYYTDEFGNVKGESTTFGNTTITEIKK